MNKTKNICIYFQNNKLVYCINNEFGIANFKSIKNNQIINIELFTNEFSNFIRNNGINNNLFGDTIYYLSTTDSILELSFIKEMLHRFSFKNTIIVDILEVLKENSYILVFKKNYLLLNNGEKYIIPKIYNNILIDILNKIEYQKIYVVGDFNIFNNINNVYSIYTPKDFLLTKLREYLHI
ncbi:MAG: hypothetical protein ACI31M_04870 [Bacilli bacterium]